MPDSYTIYIINNSTSPENFTIFQQPPVWGNTNTINPAWLAHSGQPGEKVSFNWEEEDEPDATKQVTRIYWIGASPGEPGEVSDPDQMIGPVEVAFPPGSCAMQVTLNADNSWTVAEG